MKQDAPEPRPWALSRAALVVLVCALLAALGVLAGHRFARTAVVDIGPADGAWAAGFRDLERDGDSYFRWSSVPTSTVTVPVRFCGPGAIQIRLRRHFTDPAQLTVSLNGTLIGSRTVQARQDKPYEVITFPVSKAICGPHSSVILESEVSNGRPLGVAVDWITLQSPEGFQPVREMLVMAAVAGALIAAAAVISGASLAGVLGAGMTLALALATLFAFQTVPSSRILAAGVPALTLTLVIGAGLARLFKLSELSRSHRLWLLAFVLGTLAVRTAFLHPLTFYPDYRVHALVGETLSRGGLSSFLSNLFTIQYARSLGLQQIEGRWYPFPYPPGAYILIEGVARVFGLRVLEAALATAAAASALLPLLVVPLARALGFGAAAGIRASGFMVLHPLLVRRMALGYFPGLIGQFLDALALLLFIRTLSGTEGRSRPLTRLVLTGALLAGFLVYTQSIANFGIFIAMLLLTEVARRTPQTAAAVRGGAAALVALVLAVGIFYSTYAPVFRNIREKRPQPESVVLDRLEKTRAEALPSEGLLTDDDEADPFSGSSVDPSRGVARLGARLWRFQGAFSLLLVPGIFLMWRVADRARRNVLLAWLSVPVWINILAAGLPSPNGFQHLKDLEFATPLFALALGSVWGRLNEIRPAAAWMMVLAWTAYAGSVTAAEFVARLLPLLER